MPASYLLPSGDIIDSERQARCDVLLALTHLNPGGTLEVLIMIARELRALGLRIAIVALYRGRDADLRDLDCDILVDRERLDAGGYAKAFVKLAKRIKVMRPTAILSFMPAANVMGAISAAFAGVRCRVASHHQTRSAQHVVVRAIDRVLGSIGVYSHMIAVSQSVRASFLDYPHAYVDRVRVIPNAIRPIAPRVERSTVRKSLGVRPDAILLAAIGRLAQEKNVLRTVAGAIRVPNVQLALVGEGPQRPEIESYVTSAGLDGRVILVGQVDHQAALDILFAADIFVQLSHVEGRSIALLEALCARKAILASDVPSQREVLTSDDGTLAGMVCDPMDEDAIAAAVSTIANSESLRHELGARAAALAAGLDPEQMGRDYVSLLNGR